MSRLEKQLDQFTEQLQHILPQLNIVSCNEAYTSVQADVLLEQENHPWQDAVAAMYILETYLESEKQ